MTIDGQDVFALRRPLTGEDYLQGQPEEIDIQAMLQGAGLVPRGGNSQFIKVVRRRSQCDVRVWGPNEYTLFEWNVVWQDPTLQMDLDLPSSVQPGQTFDVVVQVALLDQFDQPGNPEGIDVSLSASGGSLQAASGKTDAQGVFRTQMTAADPSATGTLSVQATASIPEGVQATASGNATVGSAGSALLWTFDADPDGWTAEERSRDDFPWRSVGWNERQGGVALFDGVGWDGEPNSWLEIQVELPDNVTTMRYRSSAHDRGAGATSIRVRLEPLGGQITTVSDWEELSTGADGFEFVDHQFDISSWAGQTVTLFIEHGDIDGGGNNQRWLTEVEIGR